jgi:hypothetical protein
MTNCNELYLTITIKSKQERIDMHGSSITPSRDETRFVKKGFLKLLSINSHT